MSDYTDPCVGSYQAYLGGEDDNYIESCPKCGKDMKWIEVTWLCENPDCDYGEDADLRKINMMGLQE